MRTILGLGILLLLFNYGHAYYHEGMNIKSISNERIMARQQELASYFKKVHLVRRLCTLSTIAAGAGLTYYWWFKSGASPVYTTTEDLLAKFSTLSLEHKKLVCQASVQNMHDALTRSRESSWKTAAQGSLPYLLGMVVVDLVLRPLLTPLMGKVAESFDKQLEPLYNSGDLSWYLTKQSTLFLALDALTSHVQAITSNPACEDQHMPFLVQDFNTAVDHLEGVFAFMRYRLYSSKHIEIGSGIRVMQEMIDMTTRVTNHINTVLREHRRIPDSFQLRELISNFQQELQAYIKSFMMLEYPHFAFSQDSITTYNETVS